MVKWKKITEYPMPKGVEVLVTIENHSMDWLPERIICRGIYEDGKYDAYGTFKVREGSWVHYNLSPYDDYIVAWIPIPEAYAGN